MDEREREEWGEGGVRVVCSYFDLGSFDLRAFIVICGKEERLY